MRVLVTNDDGIHAPGLAALTRALGSWASEGPGALHEVVVVAPLANHSGAGAAIGTVYERESIYYQRVRIDGAEHVPTFGVDASPALAVLVGASSDFGPRPDVVISGINHGANVGRAILHSGTVGATLAGAQLGLRGLAVSMRAGVAPEEWATASALALALLAALGTAPPATVLNLNVPCVPLAELRGLRRARIGASGLVTKATALPGRRSGQPALDGLADEGEVRLTLGSAAPTLGAASDTAGRGDGAEPDDRDGTEPDDDASLMAAGFATVTPIVGVHEDRAPGADAVVRAGLDRVHALLGR